MLGFDQTDLDSSYYMAHIIKFIFYQSSHFQLLEVLHKSANVGSFRKPRQEQEREPGVKTMVPVDLATAADSKKMAAIRHAENELLFL